MDVHPILSDPARLAALARTGLPDRQAEPIFDRLTRLATRFLGTPIAMVTLVESERLLYQSCIGVPESWSSSVEALTSESFCQHVVTSHLPLVIDDARLDPLVKDGYPTKELGVLAYLGVPLEFDGQVIGTLCVVDTRPRAWTDEDVSTLGDLGHSVISEIRLWAGIDEIARQKAIVEDERQRYKVTLSSIGDAVIATDAQGAVTFMNSIAETLCGWSAEEARSRPLESVFRIVNEKTRMPVDNPIERVLATGKVTGLANHTLLIARDGTERPIEDSASPIRLDDGSIIGSVLVFRDVSGPHEKKRQLETAQLRLDSMLSAGNIGTWEYDIVNNVVTADANLARIYGVTPPEPMSGPVSLYMEIIHPDDHAKVLETVGRAIDSSDFYEADYRLVVPDQSVRWVVSRGRVQRDEAGKAVRLPGVVVDITRQKLVEEERTLLVDRLRDADRHKDEFLAILAHELRNPLAVISGGVQLIKTDQAAEVLDQVKEMIDHQARHLTHLIDDLLDVSRVATGKIVLRKETVELGVIVARAIDQVRPLIEEKRHELTVTLPDSPVRLVADPTRTAQILGNLLTNSAKYTPAGGRIRIEAKQDGDQVVVKVVDNGVGIPPEMLPGVFGLFTQIDSSIDRSQGGLGIGLTLVSSLAEKHGGRVTAASDGSGRGAEFTVYLPIGEPTAEPIQAAAPRAIRPSQSIRRILLVDDNRDTAKITGRLLAHHGFEVHLAYDGFEGLEAASRTRPHIMLLDIGLPGMDGYEVASTLRNDEAFRDTLIIAVSGYGEENSRRRSLEAGFNHHLTKPVDLKELLGLMTQGT